MDVNHFAHEWSYQNLKFIGHSLSGIRTSLAMPEFSLCFDVSQGYPFALNMRKFFLTHGHLDHAAGIPYIISQKAMYSAPVPEFYMPPSLVEPMHRLMKIWMEIEKHEYKYHFHPINENSKIDLNPNYFVQPFKTVHRIESFGYTLVHRNKKLKPEYSHLSGGELRNLKEKGADVSQAIHNPLVSFTGDTQIECLDVSPEIKNSKILFIETTYMDEKKPIAHAKGWGHTHLDELIDRLGELNNEKIVLIHLSSRYSSKMAAEILAKKLPNSEKDRVEIFLGR